MGDHSGGAGRVSAGRAVGTLKRDLGRFADGTRIAGFAGNGGNEMLNTPMTAARRAKLMAALAPEDKRWIDNDLGYTYGNARYAKGKMAVQTTARTGQSGQATIFASTATQVAQRVGERYSNRERAFIMSPGAFVRFQAGLEQERNRLVAMRTQRAAQGT